jgi:DNA modification methylase
MKPIKLLSRLLLNSTQQGDKVLDPFGGSGSTLIACEQTKRKCYAVEISPEYCSTIIERWEALTGQKAEKVKS